DRGPPEALLGGLLPDARRRPALRRAARAEGIPRADPDPPFSPAGHCPFHGREGIPMTDIARKYTAMTPRLYDYLLAHNPAPDAVLADLRRETAALGSVAVMQIAVEQGLLLTLLARILGSRRAVEVGTFTGYSAISIARGLAPGGRLLCCDVSEEYAAIARRAFGRAGVAERIDLVVAPAIETLRKLPPDEEIDFSFIDADKVGYRGYYEELISRTRPGGLVLF